MKLDAFISWLRDEMRRQNLSQADLAKRGHLSTSQVSKIINMISLPSQNALIGLAQALKIPPDIVFREAGLLPPLPDEDDTIRLIKHIYENLDEPGRSDLVEYARLRLKIQEKRGDYKAGPKEA